ncbi:Inner membrane protein [Rubellimicrobium mesophilum DSM 19309]|uniref:Inner membrane protein n=2 Tax=Rubellimicrobium TaxID=295418 RepID=A0A017HSN3_9RHOB|nr:Inner membrane protein [Rubellimicrobium mesophilum DSM 19309]
MAASFLSEHYGAPAMLFALLLGMAFNFMAVDPRAALGLGLASRTFLRLGVALLGLRLTFADVSQLGWPPVLGIVALLALTLLSGLVIARVLGRPLAFGLLTGGAVAICGASAALAIAAVIPKARLREEDVLLTVVGVTALSTLAMILYPVLFGMLGLTEVQQGYLIGATIHDVAQVVGAGYSVGERAGDIATFTKLERVALLPVVLLTIAFVYRGEASRGAGLPWFVVVFVLLMVLRNLLPWPEVVLSAVNNASRFLLVTAIAALGVKTSLGQVFATGGRGLAVVGLETFLLLGMALGAMHVLAVGG